MIARLRSIDLGFVVAELDQAFQAVKGKLQAVAPATVRGSVEQAFAQALDGLDVQSLLPAAALESIDASYDGMLQAVQPLYDERVVPLIAAFDLTLVLEALIARLDALKLELRTEFDKVDTAYQRMLGAVPTLSLTDISLDVDLGVDIGF